MRLLQQFVAFFGLYLTFTTAIPVFNTANDYDLSGHVCKLHTARNVVCPVLCVSNLNSCPQKLKPSCPPGQTFCSDGACHTSCDSVANVCDCGVVSQTLFPCMSGQVVDIPNFNATDRDAMTTDACNKDVTQNYPSMDASAKDIMWLKCPVAPLPTFTYTEPMFISIYAIVGAELLLLVAWHMYKTAAEKSVKVQLATIAKKGLGEKELITHHESDGLHFQGFNNNFFGTIVMVLAYAIAIGWLVLLAIFVADYYGVVTGVAYGVLLTTDLSSKIFCVCWHATAVWLVVLYISSSSIRNYFRIQSLVKDGGYIQVKKRKDPMILLDEDSFLLRKLRQGESLFIRYFGGDYLISTSKVSFTEKNRKYFEFQCTRYVYNPENDSFTPFVFYLAHTNEQLHKHSHGLTKEEANYRLELLGPNFISVYVPSFFVAVIQEFGAYFYLYQMMCLWVWYYFNYYMMGLVQTVVIIISAIIKVFLRLRSEHKVKSLAEFKEDCVVLRDGNWITVSSTDLVTGDVFEVQSDHCMPCDAVILSGEVIVDESSLTGEAMPVRKFPIKDDEGSYDPSSSKSSTLYCGTTVLQVSPVSEDGKVKAIVAATGTATDKGNMVHKILFPSPVSFIFDEQLKIVVIILLMWGVVAFGLSLWLMGRGDIVSWFYGIFIISQIMSPLLPAALVVGQSVAAGRLRSKHIYCVDLPRIMIAGKVQIFCFDKTGTLTREGLDYYGVSTVKSLDDGSHHFEEREESVPNVPVNIQMGLATCHAVTQVNGQFIGNPVDIEMFRATKWNLVESNNISYLDSLVPSYAPEVKPVHIIKRFEFVHARASMSVAVLDSSTGHVHIFIKGSFEKIKELSSPESIPHDFDNVTASYAREGCYVLALAHRDLGPIDIETVKGWSREKMEREAAFAGLILFKNKLKDDTTAAIAELKGGDTRTVMITGDNALTGIYIARACGMMPTGTRVLLGDVVAGSKLAWMDFDTSEYLDVDETLQNFPNEVELAVTAKAFDELVRNGNIRKYLMNIRVFARMTPDGKVQCVQLHMERSVVGMCGDGGNDCGALRAAHVGIALSEAEASIVSPFSTSVRSIYSCVELLKQGRTALATSFAVFKFLILYGETMANLELMQYYFTVIVQQWIWVVIDSFVTVGLAWALTLAKPAAKLAPERPTARLLGPATLTSAISQIFVNLVFIMGAFGLLFSQEWFVCNEFDGASADAARWWLLADSFEAELIAIVCLYQFIHSAAVFNFGYKFRQSWWRNYILAVLYLGMMSFVAVLNLADPNRMSCLFRINCGSPDILVEQGYPRPTWYIEDYNSTIGHNVMPHKFRWILFIYCMINCLINILVEYFVVLGPIGRWIKNKYPSKARRNRIKFKL